MTRTLLLTLCFVIGSASAAEPIRHGFLATGGETFIVDESGKETWKYPVSTRDGWVLPSGNILLALSKNKAYPGGAVRRRLFLPFSDN